MGKFNVVSEYIPRGDQPKAIKQLAHGIDQGYKFQTLLGATGVRAKLLLLRI